MEEAEYSKNRAAMEAFLAKLFATISTVKAAYVELQMAQFPYNNEAIQFADQVVVDKLKALSELKHCFVKKKIDSSPLPHNTHACGNSRTAVSYALRSVHNFVKLFVREMESVNWDIEAAANAIQPEVAFNKRDHNHQGFAFESFVCKEILSGFNNLYFSKRIDQLMPESDDQRRVFFFEQFKKEINKCDTFSQRTIQFL
ncbi:protein GRAVITROPIC IN THE LIGHT 1-like [Forsythia ovata]|uniref:Protein GRAVITROPIC IN THE LIGHT 1-like n=1 Tax=Forsythia ovata TaxID=205694 RepID=A0ABD1RJ55_9LAMI